MIPDNIPHDQVVPAHALAADVVLQREGVNPALGLSEAEARLTRYGPNALLAHAPRTALAILIDQFNSPVVWLLSAAAALAAAFSEWKEAAAILIVLVINTLIGFFTEIRAVRSMEALRKLGTRSSRVRRDGKLKTVAAKLVVPGDIVLLESGDVVTADIRLSRRVISLAMNRRSPANPCQSKSPCTLSPPTPSSPSGPRCCTRAPPLPAEPVKA